MHVVTLPALTGRDPKTGRFVHGNTAALATGERSLQFWQAAEQTRCEIVAAVIKDAGHSETCRSLKPCAVRFAPI